jgi:acyl carrier protein
MPESIEERLRRHLVEQLGVPAGIGDNDALLRKGYLDSAQLIDVVLFVEEEFDVVLRPIDVVPDNMESVATMAKVIRERIEAGKP